MELYYNLGGNSGVSGYKLGDDRITVQFNDGSKYLYTYSSTGVNDVEHMKSLASKGVGLNSFISRIVRKRFATKIA